MRDKKGLKKSESEGDAELPGRICLFFLVSQLS